MAKCGCNKSGCGPCSNDVKRGCSCGSSARPCSCQSNRCCKKKKQSTTK